MSAARTLTPSPTAITERLRAYLVAKFNAALYAADFEAAAKWALQIEEIDKVEAEEAESE